MNNYNPIGLRICTDGVTRNKCEDKDFKRRRRLRMVHPAAKAVKPK